MYHLSWENLDFPFIILNNLSTEGKKEWQFAIPFFRIMPFTAMQTYKIYWIPEELVNISFSQT